MSGLHGVGGILDDLIITGSNDEKEKCVFMKPTVEYFAFVVDRDGIHPSPCKVEAIRGVQVSDNPTELKSFLGMVNYY